MTENLSESEKRKIGGRRVKPPIEAEAVLRPSVLHPALAIARQEVPVLRYIKLNKDLPDLVRGSAHSAGIDLYNAGPRKEIRPLFSESFDNGVAIEIPEGYFGLVTIRSGLGMKGLASHVGIIDSDYRGPLKTKIFNHGPDSQDIDHFARIAQLIIVPYYHLDLLTVEELSDTLRGTNGFGSTGV